MLGEDVVLDFTELTVSYLTINFEEQSELREYPRSLLPSPPQLCRDHCTLVGRPETVPKGDGAKTGDGPWPCLLGQQSRELL